MEPAYQEKSVARRALLPVLGGIAFFALLGLATWGIAVLLAGNSGKVEERLAQTTFEVGNAEYLSNLIKDDGPMLFQGLVGDTADRSLVLDHTGDDVKNGWRVRYAFPSDRTDACKVKQVRGTAQFTDCEGRTLSVDDLTRPQGVKLLVGDVIVIDLRGAREEADREEGVTTTTSTTLP